MYVLGIEAATTVVSVALIKERTLLAERFFNGRQAHSANLPIMIKSVLEETGVSSAQQLAGIAVSTGPGSFTGLRIGLVTAKTLAQVWALPLVGVGTLDALAYLLAGPKGLVCPVINARKNEVYAAVYDASSREGPQCLLEAAAKTPEELAAQLKELKKPVTLGGDGAILYQELFRSCLGEQAVFVPEERALPRGAAVAGLGRQKLLAGEVSDPFSLQPLYLKMSEAEIKWRQKQKAVRKI